MCECVLEGGGRFEGGEQRRARKVSRESVEDEGGRASPLGTRETSPFGTEKTRQKEGRTRRSDVWERAQP
eukprot:4241761-Pleurochrysis_carterae.AAC.3